MGVCITVKQVQIHKTRTLAIGQVNGRFIHSSGNHTGSQNYHVHVQDQIITKQGILGGYSKTVSGLLNLCYCSFGHEDTVFLLHSLVKQLGVTRGTHMLVQDIGLPVHVVFTDILGLFQGNHGGNGVTVREVVVIIFTAGALDKGNTGRNPAILGKFFKLGIGDHIL